VSAIKHAKPGTTELRTLAAYVEALGGRLEIIADSATSGSPSPNPAPKQPDLINPRPTSKYRSRRFAGQEPFKVVLTDQPTAPCLDRSELACAQQVMDELSGDAQQFGGLLRAVGEPFGEGVTIEDFAHQGEQLLAHVAGEKPRYRACA
jgi:hypothetical protein